MNAHSKNPRIVTLDGVYVLDPSSGHYEPEAMDQPLPYRGLILVAACLVGWAAFIGAAYAIYQAIAALAG